MSKKQFGYIGAAPTQSFQNLPSKYNPINATSNIEFLVIAGGGAGGWADNINLCTVTVSVGSGEKVLLQGTAAFSGSPASGDEDAETGIIRIRRGSTNLESVQCGFGAACAALQYVDTGQSGSVTYNLYMTKTGYTSYNGFTIGENSLVATRYT